MRVLVVEDEARMGALLRRGLGEEGYAVDIAASGDDGLWMATENDYDAVVLAWTATRCAGGCAACSAGHR